MHPHPPGTTLLAALAAAVTVGAATATLAPPVTGTAAAAGCADIRVVAARGTGEPGGWWSKYHLGTVVGNPVYKAINDTLDEKVDAYRVDYPADHNQPASVQAGNRDLVEHVTTQAAACPDQRFVLVGYSQGANVVDNSLGFSSEGAKVGGPIVATLPDELEPRIVAVLLFGNPIRELGRAITGTYAGRTLDICNDNDPVCDPDGSDWNVHLRYARHADKAAKFVRDRV
ncbi:cutinase family protein [Nocardia rhizosphaerae]|uniref:Cutinase family protein n=1 Tax=Nocardia rhizosphaerae TaxID=1691571 RepID=A0ABV8LB16_9NOCA